MWIKKPKNEVLKPKDEQDVIRILKTAKSNNEVYSRKGLIIDVYNLPQADVKKSWDYTTTEVRRAYNKLVLILSKLQAEGKVNEIKNTQDGVYAYEWIGN